MVGNILRTSYGVAAALLLVSACEAPLSMAPTPPAIHPGVAGASVSGGARVLPNSHRYREPAYAHATGRSGNARLTARALLGRDGSSTLDVTTGELDGAAPGELAKLQVKLLDPKQQLDRTVNFTALPGGGATTLSFAGRPPHSFMQVQASVRGIDRRTDVVTVTERVNARPDLRVVGLSVPARARVSTPVTIVADVAEGNGDLGARADCVLRVDGSEVDRIVDIWVAEGGLVGCEFEHTFERVGSHSVEVAAERVRPGDWNQSDNGASATVEITSAAQALPGTARVSGATDDFWYGYDIAWSSSDGTHGTERYRYNNFRRTQYAWAGASSNTGSFGYPLVAGSHAAMVVDGRVSVDIDLAGAVPEGPDARSRRFVGRSEASVTWVQGLVIFGFAQAGEDALYLSSRISDAWNSDGTNVHLEYQEGPTFTGDGELTPPPATVEFHLLVSDGVLAFRTDPVVRPEWGPAEPYGSPEEPSQCWTDTSPDGTTRSEWCYFRYGTARGYNGYTSGF